MKRRPGYYSPSKLQWTVLVAFSMTALTGQTKQPDTVHASSNPPVENMGVLQLKRGYPDLAKTTCETILKADPKNEAALQCLDGALLELEKREAEAQYRALTQAESLLQLGKKAEALAAVDKIQAQIHRSDLADRAVSILKKAGEVSTLDRVKQHLSDFGITWILDVVISAALIVLSYWALKFLRYLTRKRKQFKSRYKRKLWRITPIEDKTEVDTSSFVLSAYDSLKSDLSDSSNPILLFVPPAEDGNGKRVLLERIMTGPGGGQGSGVSAVRQSDRNGERSTERDNMVSRHLLSGDVHAVQPEGFLDLKHQNFEFLDAVKELGVKVGGTDFAGVGRFVAAIGKWFDAGVPTLTGSAFKDSDRVVVSLTCCDATSYTTVSAKGRDATVEGAQEAADTAVYKMLYILGHQGSSSRDADAAASLRRQGRAVREYLSGEKPAGEELDKLCNELAETRFLISISSSVPEYLIDRALMWEATARFLRNGNKDLERTLDLLEQLRESKGRTEAKHDIYNAAVICRLLGRFNDAYTHLVDLAEATDALKKLVIFEKVRFLTNEECRKVWDKRVLAWKEELRQFATRAVQASSDEFSQELRCLRSSDAAIWNAIVAIELDYPQPSRSTDWRGDVNSKDTLRAAKDFFESWQSTGTKNLANLHLQLARVYLYLGEFTKAREEVGLYRKSQAGSAVAVYVEAECTYAANSPIPAQQNLKTWQVIEPLKDDQYPPLQALKNLITT
jgi:hypothetical protein